jgi:predicted nucleotidyltransferase
MENRIINIGVVEEVAKALGDFKENVVFIGGAVVSMYADDIAADEVRPTGDIDMTVNIIGFSNWTQLQEQLVLLGFNPDPFGHSICSYKYKNIPVDIMPAEDSPIGPANRWYIIGFNELWIRKANEEDIKILSAPCYLATKFEAFNDRGSGDYRTSHDFEDIIYVIDNRTTIIEEIKVADDRIKLFLIEEVNKILESHYYEEILSVHLHPLIAEERYPILLDKFENIRGL